MIDAKQFNRFYSSLCKQDTTIETVITVMCATFCHKSDCLFRPVSARRCPFPVCWLKAARFQVDAVLGSHAY